MITRSNFPFGYLISSVYYRFIYLFCNFVIILDDGKSRYSGLCRMVQKLVNILKQMDPRDPYRVEMTDVLLEKL